LMPSIGMERFDDEHDAHRAMAQPNCLHSSSQRPAGAENSGLISGSRRRLVRPAAQPRVVHRSAVICGANVLPFPQPCLRSQGFIERIASVTRVWFWVATIKAMPISPR
jgi:hypothetical protein